jgi:hypothetical protein
MTTGQVTHGDVWCSVENIENPIPELVDMVVEARKLAEHYRDAYFVHGGEPLPWEEKK